MRKSFVVTFATAALLVLLSAGPAAAQACWVAAGSSASIFPEDLSNTVFSASNLEVSGSSPLPFTVDGILNVNGISLAPSAGNSKALLVRYRDNGPDSRVILRLRQVDIATGAGTTLITFDSDSFPQQSTGQTQGICLVGAGGFDFNTYMYFLKVEVTRSGSGGTTSLQIAQACTANC